MSRLGWRLFTFEIKVLCDLQSKNVGEELRILYPIINTLDWNKISTVTCVGFIEL